MTFYKWLQVQIDKNSDIAGLAIDIMADDSFPKDAGYREMKRYLINIEASKDTIRFFEWSHKVYLDDTRKKANKRRANSENSA